MNTPLKKKIKYSRQNKLAGYFGKKYGEFLYSGSLALEVALKCADVQKNDYVLIPNHVCYRVLSSVIRMGARPIIVTPSNGYILDKFEIENVIKKYPVKAIILVHNLGLPVEIKSIKKVCPKNVTIIEDAAQSWQLKSKDNEIGRFSDYVVTSFGISKPLSQGIGGAIFSNTEYFRTFLDDYSRDSRENKKILLPYVLPDSTNIDVDELIKTANKNITHQRLIADCLTKELKKSGFKFWELQPGDQATWHRFPIWTEKRELYEKAIKTANDYLVNYELPHKISLDNLPLATNNLSIHVGNTIKKYYHINIKTKQNSLINIQKWTKSLK
ncbi:MAG: DegT/DnrJ/EryC1/StrS family aminotransferase [Candidatus Shapirobacteria bacterium]